MQEDKFFGKEAVVMKIKKRLLCGVLSVVMLGTANTAVFAKSFPDSTGHWAETAIGRWSDYGVINGDDQGNFRPGDSITRAETATLLNNLIGYKSKSTKSFADVSDGDWFADAVLKLNYAEVMTGYEDGAIRPRNAITRQEAAVMIARATGLVVDNADKSQLDKFSDKDLIQTWAEETVALMTERGYMQGNDGKFRPTDSITRAEVVTLIDNIVGIYANGQQIQYTGDYGEKLAIVKQKCTFKGVVLGGAVISPEVTGSVIFNNASEINGCIYDLSEYASLSTTGADYESVKAPYKKGQSYTTSGSSYGNSYYGGSSSSSSGSSSSSSTSYTVKFDANGGKFDKSTTVYSVTYKSNEKYSARIPSDPEKDGYVFEGWYTTKSGASSLSSAYKLDDDTRVTSSDTLYAGWSVDASLYPSVKAASGTVYNKNASDLMDVKLTQKEQNVYNATGTLYYVKDFDYPAIDPSGNYLALTYTLPSSMTNPKDVTLNISFGAFAEKYSSFTESGRSHTVVLRVSEDDLNSEVVFKTTVKDSDEEIDDITVNISKLKLSRYREVSTEEELVAALADADITAITVKSTITLSDGKTYTPSQSIKKAITLSSPLVLPADSNITIKGITFNTDNGLALSSLFDDKGCESLTFEENTVDGAFASVIPAGSGTYAIKNNVFKNTYTKDGGFSGADMTEQTAVVAAANGSFEISGNTFEGYSTALKYNTAAKAISLTKNCFAGNSCDVQLVGASSITKENMPSLAYNYYDDNATVSGGIYTAYPIYTDKECTTLSDNIHDAWIVAETDGVAKLYSLSETSYIPFEDGKETKISVFAKDARSTAASITVGENAPADNVTVTSAATVLSIKVDDAEAKKVTVGHTSTEITVKASTTAEDIGSATAIVQDNGSFKVVASDLAKDSKLYIKVTAEDETHEIISLSADNGEEILFDQNGIAELVLGDATVLYTVKSVVDKDGNPVTYTINVVR